MKKVVLGFVVFGAVAFAGFIGSGGVSNVQSAGYSDSTQWYVVSCKDGSSYKIGKMSSGSAWWGQSGGQLPGDYTGLSITAAAEKACR
ncbi:MAG: hypothetical protein WA080_02330 [Sulfuricurvum sp.]